MKTQATADLVRPFAEAVEAEPEKQAAAGGKGRGFIGYFCSYTPVELILAAGFTPVRITGGGETTGRADILTPSFLCPYLRRAVEKGMEGRYGFLSGIVQGYTCDAACGVVNVWAENMKGKVFHTLPLPYNDSPEAREFFRAVLAELIEKLNGAGGDYSPERLEDALALYGDMRDRVLDLYERRYRGQPCLPAGEFLTVIQAGYVTHPGRYRDMLGTLTDELDASPPTEVLGTPVLVSGSLIEEPRVLEILEQCGARVAADDLCSGWRNLYPPRGEGATPMDRLIDRYMRRAPCPARARAEDRAGVLLDLIDKSGAKGAVFILQKFCTPHLGDLPAVTDMLKSRGVPSLVVEMEESGLAEGQLRTRFETFMELLRD